MIPYETDPTLHDHEPPRGLLDDGFSRPMNPRRHSRSSRPARRRVVRRSRPLRAIPDEAAAMATHPVEPEPSPDQPQPESPNPSHLPVEPEFGPMLPPGEPEDPRGKPPTL
jgi:hypothetical protein